MMSKQSASSACVYYKDNGGVLFPVGHKASEAILAAAVKGLRYVETEPGQNGPKFDLKHMKQVKPGLSKEEAIIIEIPWNAQNLQAARRFNADESLRRKILEMALDRIIGQQSLCQVLEIQGVPYSSVRKNPYLGPGHLPYDNFVDCLMTATASKSPEKRSSKSEILYVKRAWCITAPSAFTLWRTKMKLAHTENIIDFAADGSTSRELRDLQYCGLRFVFHGTNEAVMESILKDGLLPEFRGNCSKWWFGVSPSVSFAYTKTKTSGSNWSRVLHFMVLHPIHESASAVSSSLNGYQLPVADITLLSKGG